MFFRSLRRLAASFALAVPLAATGLAQQSYVYVNNQSETAENSVSVYAADSGGSLTPIPGSPFATGGTGRAVSIWSAQHVRVHTPSRLLFVANGASSTIAVFRIDPATGSLAAVPGSPFRFERPQDSTLPDMAMAVSPDGRYLFVTAPGFQHIAVYRIAKSGALKEIEGSPVPAPSSIVALEVTPDGRFLLMTGFQQVSSFVIDRGGDLRFAHTLFLEQGPVPAGIAIASQGRRAFVAGANTFLTIDGFEVWPSGTITRLAGAPLVSQSGGNTYLINFAGRDNFLYTFNAAANTISGFVVAVDGSLSPVAGERFALTQGFTTGMATNVDGSFLFTTTDGPDELAVYSVRNDGSLQLVPGGPVATEVESYPGGIAVFPSKTGPTRVCLFDDASGDSYTQVVDAAHPDAGTWIYHVAATGETITGRTSQTRYVIGSTLVASDKDFSAENTTHTMKVSVDFDRGRGTVQVKRKGSPEKHRLTDSSLDDDPACP